MNEINETNRTNTLSVDPNEFLCLQQVAERTEVEGRNYEFKGRTDTIGGNKMMNLKAGKMQSPVKMC